MGVWNVWGSRRDSQLPGSSSREEPLATCGLHAQEEATGGGGGGGGASDSDSEAGGPLVGAMRSEEACQLPFEAVAERLGSDLRRGLSWQEAHRRLLTVGANEFEVRQEEPLCKKYLDQVGPGPALRSGPQNCFQARLWPGQTERFPAILRPLLFGDFFSFAIWCLQMTSSFSDQPILFLVTARHRTM